MNNQQFRGLLLKLQDHLTDNDRKRLHFFFGDDVPRRIRDDPSLSGTLSLMESLFEQDKINEQDFTVLINAFNEIRCHDAVKLLKKHMKQMQQSNHQGTIESLSSIMSSTDNQHLPNEVEEEEDKFNVKTNYAHFEKKYTYNNNQTDSNVTNITPVTVVVNQQSTSNSSLSEKTFWTGARLVQLVSFLLIMVLICIVAILSGFYVRHSSRIDELERKQQSLRKIIMEERLKRNETIQINKMFSTHINDLEKKQNSSLIRDGTKFGGVGGGPFDDSYMRNFTPSYYLHGMLIGRKSYPSYWVQFLYSSFSSHDTLEGEIHGTRLETDDYERFLLDRDEKVLKVQIVSNNVSYIIGGVQRSVLMIAGIRLFTTKGRSSSPLDNVDGAMEMEEADGYTMGYASGRAGLGIDQIQFHWYRTSAE